MRLIMIDDRGELWSDRSAMLQSFAPGCSSDRVSGYLVKNLGFIAVDMYARSCQVRVRPAIVTQAAFERLIDWLVANKFQRLALGHFDGSWQLELHGSVELLSHRLLTLINMKQLARPADFIAEGRTVDTLDGYPQLKALVDNWGELSVKLGRMRMSRLVKKITQGRFMVVEHTAATDCFTISEIGGGYLAYTPRWSTEARGRPLERQPDHEYGRAAIAAYRKTLASGGQPHVDDVDAIISTEQHGRYRVRYRRLILAKPGDPGKSWLLSSSVLDERIDLRAKAFGG